MINEKSRIVCQFSCGAASAVATKLAIAQYAATHEVVIVNAYLANEHPDNRRFAAECEAWFGQAVTVLRDTKYGADIIQVFKRERYIKNRFGACCTKLLKRRVLDQWKRPGDVMVFGFTAEERSRFDDFCERNPDRPAIAPLIERGLGKDDCKAMIERAGIELPLMYRMGYDNANCIACAKGGEGYFRAIREDFPEQFEDLCQVQDVLGPGSYLHRNRETNVRFSLRELGEGPVRRNEKIPACSFFCELAEADIIASA
jgi:3'-phosphoadenosine 5'-phosphosulfate sulfotransferase (PAPS reductase)/FAD synthetase